MPPPKLPTRLVNVLSTHTGPVNCIAFSSLGGTYILSGSSDRSIHLSRAEPASGAASTSSTPIQKYTSHGYPVLSVSVTQSNTHFASSGGDRSVFYWDVQTPASTLRRFGSNTSEGHTSRITCVSFAGDDDGVLASGSDDRSVRLWDVKSRDSRPLQVLDDAKDGISALVVQGKEIMAGSIDSRIRTYDVRMGRCVVDVQPGPVTSLDISRDGQMVLVGCLDGRLRLMDRKNGALLKMIPDAAGGDGYTNRDLRLQSCFAANEALVISGSETDGKVRAWDILTGKKVGEVDVNQVGKVVSVVKLREGSKVQDRRELWAAGGSDGMVRIYGES